MNPIAHALQDKLPVIKREDNAKSNTRHHRKPPASRPPEKRARTDIAPQGLYHFVQPRTQDTQLGGMGTDTRKTDRAGKPYRQIPADPDLPENQAVTTDDYKRSGMDRGHMCPAGDNRWHWKAMQESFYMTNICPQNHNLNRGDWKELEDACRLWTKKEGKLYIVCGPVLYRQKHRP